MDYGCIDPNFGILGYMYDMDKGLYGLKDYDGWNVSLKSSERVGCPDMNGYSVELVLGCVFERKTINNRYIVRVHPVVIRDDNGWTLEYMDERTVRVFKDMLSESQPYGIRLSYDRDGNGWYVVMSCESADVFVKCAFDKLFYAYRVDLGHLHLNKRLDAWHEVGEVVGYFDDFVDAHDEFNYAQNGIASLREKISAAKNDVAKARGVIEQLCEKCADALNELEEKYSIKEASLGYVESHSGDYDDPRISELISRVKLGYMAMDENGELNRIIKEKVKLIEGYEKSISNTEEMIRRTATDMAIASSRLVEYGYSINV